MTINRWQYNGKELQEVAGLDMFDYGWRMSDNFTGRMNGIDALADTRPGLTPYSFVGNNPIARIELDGMDWYSYEEDDENGEKRLKYRYYDYQLSNKEMKAQGLRHEGLTYHDEKNGVYYGLYGSAFF